MIITTPEYTELTLKQKLYALAMKHYQNYTWIPCEGDYYTTDRADTELYQIVGIENGLVYTRYCDPNKGGAVSTWPVDEFLADHTFGKHRVYVHHVFLQIKE